MAKQHASAPVNALTCPSITSTMTLTPKDRTWLRLSLVFVWLATAIVSVWELDGQSRQLLTVARLHDPSWGLLLTLGGAGVDAMLGLAMLLWPSRRVYLGALAIMLVMTGVATFVDGALWLHPLGPLTKNIPIAAVLWVLARKPS